MSNEDLKREVEQEEAEVKRLKERKELRQRLNKAKQEKDQLNPSFVQWSLNGLKKYAGSVSKELKKQAR